jgi:ribonuclease HI
MKFYAIKKGKKTGIFSSWEETKELTDKFPGAIFKSFSTKHEANE